MAAIRTIVCGLRLRPCALAPCPSSRPWSSSAASMAAKTRKRNKSSNTNNVGEGATEATPVARKKSTRRKAVAAAPTKSRTATKSIPKKGSVTRKKKSVDELMDVDEAVPKTLSLSSMLETRYEPLSYGLKRSLAAHLASARSDPSVIVTDEPPEPLLDDDPSPARTDLIRSASSLAISEPTMPSSASSFQLTVSSIDFSTRAPPPTQPPVPNLAHGLSKVLYNPGTHWLRDPRSGVYNFAPRLERLVSPSEFNFDALPEYVTSSRDEQLWSLLKAHSGAKFAGSTSSMTSSLSQIYFMLNPKKRLNFSMLSAGFRVPKYADYSFGARMPASITLQYRDGLYAIDADKLDASEDDPDETILRDLGHVMEKFFVLEPERFDLMLTSNKHLAEPRDKGVREAYAYGQCGSLFTRSQLDCHSDLLPGSGTFDIKTRAVIAVRQDRLNHANAAGYQLRTQRGALESFEREWYDLIRTAFLKYQFQTRIGNMDGIFCAFHNTQKVFGFEYIPNGKMDEALFGTSEEGDKVFKLCMAYFERILQDATSIYPDQTIGLTLWAKSKQGRLIVFVYPVSKINGDTTIPDEYTTLQYVNYNYLDGDLVEEGRPVDIAGWVESNLEGNDAGDRRRLEWTTLARISRYEKSAETDALFANVRAQQLETMRLLMPESIDEVASRHGTAVGLDVMLEDHEVDLSDDPSITSSTSDDISATTSLESESSSNNVKVEIPKRAWAPSPGRKYRNAASELVRTLRSLARQGWQSQEQDQERSSSSGTSSQVTVLEAVQYRVQDRVKPRLGLQSNK